MRNSDWRYIALNMTLACFWLLSSADDISVHSWAFSPDVFRLHPLLLKWTRLISSGLGWQHLCSWEGVHIGHTLRALLQTEDLMLVVVFLVFVPYCPNALFICFYGIASYNGWWYYDYVMPHLQNAKMTIFCCSRRNKLTKCYKKVKMAPGRTFLAILSHQGPPPILQRAGGQYWKTNFISTIVMLKRSLLLNMIMMMMMLFWHLRGEPPEVSYGWFSIRESLVVLLVMMMILNNTYTGCFFSLVPH